MKRVKETIKKSDKKTLTVYLILRILVIICMIREIVNSNFENALLCVLALVLFHVPNFLERKLKIDFPTTLEIIIFLFIFAAEILGEINNFYGKFPGFDDILHALNGFLCASIGFSLVYILNENTKSIKLSPFFVTLVSFCFSMTIGVGWEFLEYSVDNILKLDMQKDEYVTEVRTVSLDPKQENNVINITDIGRTIIYNKEGEKLAIIDGYLDIGLNDTMRDLIVNFIGAVIFSIFGYLYILNEDKYNLAGKFLTKKAK